MKKDQISDLDTLRRELLMRRLNAEAKPSDAAIAAGAIGRRDRGLPVPLSQPQQRLLFISQADPAASLAYHMPAGMSLTGRLDRQALQAALDRIVQRHEILRTTFGIGTDEPIQVIGDPDVGFALAEHDITDLTPAEQELCVAEHSIAEGREQFDLKRGPLIRGRLLRLSQVQHVLLITQHHIISDGWSVGLLIRELSALYAAFTRGLPDPLPPLAVQYADYAVWQRGGKRVQLRKAQAAFWSEHLGGAPALLELATDRPRGATQGFAGDSVKLNFDAVLGAKLRSLSQRHGCTLFMTLLSAWASLLCRLSGQQEVVVGTVVANRPHAEMEQMIGFFVNTLALRVRLHDNPTVGQLLTQVKTATLQAYQNQDLPFEQVVEVLRPARFLNSNPLFQAALVLENVPTSAELTLPGLTLKPAGVVPQATHFDVSLSLNEVAGLLSGHIIYASDLFDRETIERMAGMLRMLLESMVEADGRARVGALALMEEPQRRQVLRVFNARDDAPAPRALLHQLFEQQAHAHPDDAALMFEHCEMSYGELNRRANRVAHRLLQLGVRPDDRVALCVERGFEMVVGLLGILKAGGAYVPLDPSYPRDRLQHMLTDSQPRALLTQNALVDHLEAGDLPQVLLDGEADSTLQGQSTQDPDAATLGLLPSHLAYVIYTSGSTGRPKGVMVEHASVVNFWNVLRRTTHRSCPRPSRIGLNAAFSFDMSIKGLSQLLSGHCVVIIPQAIRADPQKMLDFLEAHRVDAFDVTPSQLEPMLSAGMLQRTGHRPKAVLLGGEPIGAHMWRQLRESKHTEFFNMYGPTECTVDATIGRISDLGDRPSIGYPLANASVFLLDEHGQAVPVGVAAEILIAGAGLARGYLNNAALSAERFVHVQIEGLGTVRVYKTGDVGRWRSDGSIEYIGRNDFQVKIRGFRIELGEIEASLVGLPGVREAAVIAREDHPGDKRLVAYVVAQPGCTPVAAELHVGLKRSLAEFMLPSAYVVLLALPLTPNGKIDRAALPTPDSSAAVTRAYETPQGEVEQTVASIWQQLLRLDKVGRHDSFFELGGHSLLAVQLVSRLREALGVEIELRSVFMYPNLVDLSDHVATSTASALRVTKVDRRAPVPAAFAQRGLWFLDQLERNAGAAYHMPLGVRLKGPLDVPALKATLDRLVARHENLRTNFVSEDGELIQVISPPEIGFSLTEFDLRSIGEDEQRARVQTLISEEARRPFNLAHGPLIRGILIQVSGEEHILVRNQHHIIADGWSFSLLIKEVTSLYTAFSEGREDPLLPLAIQFADYAAWQHRWLGAGTLAKQIDYWRDRLSGAPALLDMPTDRPRLSRQSYAGASAPLELSQGLTASLRAFALRHGCTMFMTMLAAWSVLLSRLSRQRDLVIGTAVANRRHAETEQLIGLFVNTLALRVQLDDDPSVDVLLARIKSICLDAYEHQDVPFDRVVEAVQPVRSLSHSPVFQSLLVLNNFSMEAPPALPRLEVLGLQVPQATAHFDLTLQIIDRGARLTGDIEYASDLFDRETIERMAGMLRMLLESMVEADGRARVGALALMEEPQRRQVLRVFNARDDAPAPRALLHQLFEQQAHAHPDDAALMFEHCEMSYGELNRRANRVAHRLLQLGVRPDDRVALCVERGFEMVVGLLGILKAGGAYVPLDPSYPRDRLQHMLTDSQPRALLTQNALVDHLEAGDLPQVLLDGEADSTLQGQSTQDPDAATLGLLPSHLAYVIYTSGSTGRPKGVMVEHASVVNFWNVLRRTTHRSCPRPSRIGLNAAFSFDMSIKGLSQLLSGHCVVIIPQAIRADPQKMLDFLEAHRVDAFDVTPSQLEPMLSAGMLQRTGHRPKAVLLGGEPIGAHMWRQLRESKHTEFFNMYGPTECTVDATIGRISDLGDRPSIGYPLANASVFLLDEHGQAVPVGVAAEILIAGAGLARGYLNNAALSAERFVHVQIEGLGTVRVYKTGDVGRWRSDGSIEYIGRNDFQVKIRGFRIELGEIEASLVGLPGVREAAVIAREDHPGDKRLVAYVVAQPGCTPVAAELHVGLKRSLAEFMLPSAYVVLLALPLTPNGKIDRAALPTPDSSAAVTRAYETPQGEVEQTVASIWQQLLRLDKVGRHDSFFELGGHSLLAVQLVSRLREALGVDVPLRQVFLNPELAAFAAQVHSPDEENARSLIPIRIGGDEPPLFLVHPVEGEVGFAHRLTPWVHPEIPVYAFAAVGLATSESPLATVEEMAAYYVEEMLSVQPEGRLRIAGWSAGGTIAYEMARQLARAQRQVEFLGLIDTRARYESSSDLAQLQMNEAQFLVSCLDADRWLDEDLQALASRNDIEALIPLCQTRGYLQASASVSTVKRYFAVRRAIKLAVTRYMPVPTSLPVTLFTAHRPREHDESLGWDALLGRCVRRTTIGGSHRTIVELPWVQALGRAISEHLEPRSEGVVLAGEHDSPHAEWRLEAAAGENEERA